MKKPVLKVRKNKWSKSHPFVVDLRPFGKRRMYFATRSDADAECMRQKTLLERHSVAAIGLSQREMSDFIHAKTELAKHGETINDALKFRLDYLERVRRSGVTVAQLADEVLDAKRRDGKAVAYVADLRQRLVRFCQDFGNRAIASIQVDELDNWLRDLPLSPKSRANFRANIGVLFSHAEQRGIIDRNPILRTAKPKLPDNPPDIFAVDEMRALLDAAATHAPDVLPMLATGAFAGVRDAELKRLDWHEIDMARGHIEIKAVKAKSARRRIIPIQPNLAAWLHPYAAMKGRLVPEGARKKIERVRKAAALTRWAKNGLRHSFASYRLAMINDAPRVALELGHTSPQMLFSTYREVVRPEDAQRYWKIEPAAESENVVAFAS